jgi:hypothetical protein
MMLTVAASMVSIGAVNSEAEDLILPVFNKPLGRKPDGLENRFLFHRMHESCRVAVAQMFSAARLWGAAVAAFLLVLGGACSAQDQSQWGDVGKFLVQSLAPGQQNEAFTWLPDNPDPARAREAIGIIYPVIVGAAGNTGIVVGHFTRIEAGFTRDAIVTKLFGYSPRDARFFPDHIEVTTDVLGPNDPRCCPTVAQVWSISRHSWNAEAAR